MRSTTHVPFYDLHHHQSDCLPERQHRSMQEMRLHSTSGFVQSPKESSAITANCSYHSEPHWFRRAELTFTRYGDVFDLHDSSSSCQELIEQRRYSIEQAPHGNVTEKRNYHHISQTHVFSRTVRRAKEDTKLKRDVCYNQRKIGAKPIKEVR